MITTIIFDYAGVLTIGDPGFLWYSEIVPDYLERKDFFDRLGHKVDSGEFRREQFVREVSKATSVPIDDVWRGIKSKTVINEEMVELVAGLKKKYTLGLLSNYVHEWLTEILEENNLNQYFDEIVISSLEGTVKPDPEIFRITLSRLSAKPEESVFIDDRSDNLLGAEAVGMKTVLFTSAQQLKNDLAFL